jgi:tRNA A37 threonylcarbamoyladenosine biosynthesis protein TsaE
MHIATSSDNIDISSEKKTEEIARKIQKKIKVGDVIFLYGEINA